MKRLETLGDSLSLMRQFPHLKFVPNGAPPGVDWYGQREAIQQFTTPKPDGSYHKTTVGTTGNGWGKSTLAVEIAANLISPHKNKYLSQDYFTKYRGPKRIRIVSDPRHVADDGRIQDAIDEWFPREALKKENTRHDKMGYRHLIRYNGWEVQILSSALESKAFAGKEIGLIIFDEPFRRSIFRENLARTRAGGRILIFLTPVTEAEAEGVELAWIFDEMIEEGMYDTVHFYGGFEANCFPVGTEILSHDGWCPIENVPLGTTIATMNTNTWKMEWQETTGRVFGDWNTDLVSIGSQRNFVKTTPNHRVFRALNDSTTCKWDFRYADQLRRGCLLPGCCEIAQDGNPNARAPFGLPRNVWCEFMGWFLSEGCTEGAKGGTRRGYSVFICQNDPQKHREIRKLLDKTPWRWHDNKRKDMFRCSSKELWTLLSPLGSASEKYIPRDIMDYPSGDLMILWSTFLKGDGDGDRRAITTSPRLADDLQELLIRCGQRVTIRKWNVRGKTTQLKGRMVISKKEQYCVRLLNNRNIYIPGIPERFHYEGKVACVQVPNGTIVVRDPEVKSPLILGNCKTHGINGNLDHDDQVAAIQGESDEEYEARAFGRYHKIGGLVHKTWSDYRLPTRGQNGEMREGILMEPYDFADWRKFDATRPTIYMMCDPHDARPFAFLWFACFPDGTGHFIAEWPEQDGRGKGIYHCMKHTDYTYVDYVNIVREIEARWKPVKVAVRFIDPIFGNAARTQAHSNVTVKNEFMRVAREQKYPMRFLDAPGGMYPWKQARETLRTLLAPSAILPRPRWRCFNTLHNLDFAMRHYLMLARSGRGAEKHGEFLGKPAEKHKCFPNMLEWLTHAKPRWIDPEPPEGVLVEPMNEYERVTGAR